MIRRRSLLAMVFVACTFLGSIGEASHTSLPEWFRFSAVLERPPQINQPIGVIATLTALVGDLKDVRLNLSLPQGWLPASPTAMLDTLSAGTSQTFYFKITPGGALPNGIIGCRFDARIPKNALGKAIKAASKEELNAMLKSIQNLPERSGGYTDIAFALFPEEGFFPLGSDMWLYYEDQLTPPGMIKGPVLFRNPMLTMFQAQNDVLNYDKLMNLLATDPKAAAAIRTAAFNLAGKRHDYLAGLYVMAMEAYARRDYDQALLDLEKSSKEQQKDPKSVPLDLMVATGNLRGVCLWAKGSKKAAEDAFRETFYRNRKTTLHRYTLRNLGLLCLDRSDKSNAREMMRIALEYKPAYTLLGEEMKLLKKP